MERCDQALACQRAAAGRRHQHHYHNGRARRAYAFCWNIGLWSTIRWARLMPHVEWTFVCLELRRNFNKDIWGCFSGPDLDERGVYPETAWMSPLNSSGLNFRSQTHGDPASRWPAHIYQQLPPARSNV